jgi:hypothetical protein
MEAELVVRSKVKKKAGADQCHRTGAALDAAMACLSISIGKGTALTMTEAARVEAIRTKLNIISTALKWAKEERQNQL